MTPRESHTVKVTVLYGCTCPLTRPWYYCGCKTSGWEYQVRPLNYGAEDEAPSALPCPEDIASILREHPGAQLTYAGGGRMIYGGDALPGGEKLHDMAKRLAALDGQAGRYK